MGEGTTRARRDVHAPIFDQIENPHSRDMLLRYLGHLDDDQRSQLLADFDDVTSAPFVWQTKRMKERTVPFHCIVRPSDAPKRFGDVQAVMVVFTDRFGWFRYVTAKRVGFTMD